MLQIFFGAKLWKKFSCGGGKLAKVPYESWTFKAGIKIFFLILNILIQETPDKHCILVSKMFWSNPVCPSSPP